MLRLVVITLVLVCCLGAVPRFGRSRLNGRIIGGSDASIADYPYQIQVLVGGQFMCSGSIISANWAITAAHCFDYGSEDTTVRAGSSIFGQGGSEHSVLQVIVHEKYNTVTIDNDIAVIKVYPNFPLGDSVQIIPLASTTPATGVEVTIAGWGLKDNNGNVPDVLQVIKIPVVDHATCEFYYTNIGPITDHMFCSGLPEGGKDVCRGDSGGPVVANGQLVGIVSWSVTICALAQFPSVNTDVASFRSWVALNTGV